MIKFACYAALVVWFVLVVRHRWQAAGIEVDRRRNNRNPMIRKDDW